MKRRTKRDVSIFFGVILLIGVVVLGNGQLQRGEMAEKYENMRARLEEGKLEEGLNLLRWNLIRKTKGSLRKGGIFAKDLYEYNNQPVHMIGFMVPQEEFIDVTDFLMLPIPIQCYICSMPPERDILHVTLREGETSQIWEEPVLILGNLKIHEGPKQTFFYTLEDATIEAAEDEGELTRRRLELEHMLPEHETDDSMLLPGYSKDRDDTD